jgi:branched-chain amino acid transport system ATP-binding protein
MAILETQNLSISFGKHHAVNNVSLKVEEGSLTSVIGPNGAGKTTFFNLISGYYRPDRGSVLLKGKNVAGHPPHWLVRKGMGRSFQITNIFPDLTVMENVCVALTASARQSFDILRGLNSSQEIQKEAHSIVDSIELGAYKDYRASALSHGDRKLLEFGIVLAIKPTVMLLDEPTCGMNKEETNNTVLLIRQIAREKKITVLLTEHDIDLVFSISDKVVVLNQGVLIAEGTPDEIRTNKDVRMAYLGEE